MARSDLGRVIYTAEDDSSLIQVQQNRFGFNWKRADDDSDYPKFEVNGKKFLEELAEFDGFCNSEGLVRLTPTFCEVVYVNHIHPQANETIGQLFNAVFSGIAVGTSESPLSEMETLAFNRTYELGEQMGRLYAEIALSIDAATSPFLFFKLTSRMRHENGDVSDTLGEAHDWLIKAFLSLTNENCRRQRWGQSDAA
jgi:uncharacterized protein (TIGR04255 family)